MSLTQPGFHAHRYALGERLYAGTREVLARRGTVVWLQGVGARFGLLSGLEREPRSYRDVAWQDLEAMRQRYEVIGAR